MSDLAELFRSVCVKCGSTDTHVAHHKNGHACSYGTDEEAKSLADPEAEGPSCCRVPEHLHFRCRTCSYGWVGPTKDQPRGEK